MKKYINSLVVWLFGVLAFVACGSSSSAPEEVPPPVEERPFAGVWVTSVASDALNSRDKINETVDLCAKSAITDIFVVVWNKARTHYPSKVMKELIGVEIAEQYAGRDPLQEMIEAAHAKNIKVHAWFEYGFAASNGQNGGDILRVKPHWAAKVSDGTLVTKNNFEWMNSFLPEVQDFMTSLVLEVVKNYDVDGVQGDDRLPALPSTGGYDDYTKQLYKQEHNGVEPPTDYKNQEWVDWRADKLTDYLGKLYAAVKALKPHVMVSTAPSIHPWAKDEYLQDWPEWLNKGYTDLVIPQHYRYNLDAYQQTLAQQLSYLQAKDRKKFYPGILLQNGTYNPDEDFLRKMIETNRRNGIVGESFWFFEGLKKFPEFFSTYHQ